MRSLRARLLVAGTAILAVFGVFTFIALNRAFHASALSAQEEKMKGLVYSILGSLDLTKDGHLVFDEVTVQDRRLLSKDSGLEALVVGADRKVIWQSPSLRDAAVFPREPVETGGWRFSTAKQFQLGFGVSWLLQGGQSRKFTIFVGEDRKQYSEQLRIYHRTLAHWLAVAGILLLGVLIALLHWVLMPVHRMVGEMGEIQWGKKDGVAGRYPAELTPLAEGLNSLLRHERGQQKRYRHALDDLAHSLKTPLAALRALGDRPLSEQVGEIDKILDYQVRRASSAGRTAFTQRIRPRELAERLTSALSKVYREKHVEFAVQIDESALVPFDEGDLMEVFGNLLDNAAKWCRTRVVLSGELQPGRFTVTVEDDGPGFPKEKREDLLQRGVRADRRVSGEGIGLAVVRDIVTLYEGDLWLEESPLGGARVSLSFPL